MRILIPESVFVVCLIPDSVKNTADSDPTRSDSRSQGRDPSSLNPEMNPTFKVWFSNLIHFSSSQLAVNRVLPQAFNLPQIFFIAACFRTVSRTIPPCCTVPWVLYLKYWSTRSKFRLKFILYLITTFGCISMTVVAALSHGKIHFNLLFESLILHFSFLFGCTLILVLSWGSIWFYFTFYMYFKFSFHVSDFSNQFLFLTSIYTYCKRNFHWQFSATIHLLRQINICMRPM